MSDLSQRLATSRHLHVQQVLEGWELLGFETRNKYSILDERMSPLAYAAEEKTGLGGAIFRHFFGHWRTFRMTVFDSARKPQYRLHFPFRFFFKTLFVSDMSGRSIGRLEQTFAIFRKKFDVYDSSDRRIARINSSFFRFWTFDFYRDGRKTGGIQKKWSGALGELFTDRDNFVVTFDEPGLTPDERALMLCTCLMADIIYFENNQAASPLDLFD